MGEYQRLAAMCHAQDWCLEVSYDVDMGFDRVGWILVWIEDAPIATMKAAGESWNSAARQALNKLVAPDYAPEGKDG